MRLKKGVKITGPGKFIPRPRGSDAVVIGNDKAIFVLPVSCAGFALLKQHISYANSCASPGGAIANGKFICRLL